MKLHLCVAAMAAFALAACGKEPAPAPKKEEPKKVEVKQEENKAAPVAPVAPVAPAIPDDTPKKDPIKPGR